MMNQSLRDLQVILAEQVQDLSKSLDGVSDPAQAGAILGEMQELNHRLTLIGGLLFRDQSIQLEQKVELVRQAKGKVENALTDISKLAGGLQAFSDFLALVDGAIDLAKLI